MTDNTAGRNTPQGSSETKVHKFFSVINKNWKAVAAVGIISTSVVLALVYTPETQPEEAKADFGVVEVSPNGLIETNSQLKIVFSSPVTAHHAAEFITVNPGSATGFWSQGENANTIVFGDNYNFFYPGSPVIVTLHEGLPSDDGQKLTSKFVYEFSVKLNGEAMQFRTGNYSYRFKAFSVSEGVSFNIATGAELKNPIATLYKVPNESYLLKDLTYLGNPQNYNNLFAEYVPPVNEFQKISDYNVKENHNFSYKGEVGAYYLAGMDDGKVVADTWVVINQTGIFFRQDDRQVVLAAQNLASGQEVNNVPVTFYNLQDQQGVLRRNVINGITNVAFDDNVDLIVGKAGAETIIVPVRLPYSKAEIINYDDRDQKYKIFGYTDRPIYKPGDTLKYRGVVRMDNDSVYVTPQTGMVVEVTSGFGLNQIKQTKTTDAAGIFSGEFTVPNFEGEAKENYTGLSFLVVGQEYATSYTDYIVSRYQKPEYEIIASAEKTELTRPEVVKVKFTGKYFTGQRLKNTDIDYAIYEREYYETEKIVSNSSFNINSWGGMCGGGIGIWDEYYGVELKKGTVQLNDNGEAWVEFDTKELPGMISSEITIVATKTDNKGNVLTGAAGSIVHAGDFNVFLNKKTQYFASGEELIIPFYAEDRNGNKLANKQFYFRVYTMAYQNDGNFDETIVSGNVTTNGNGVGYIKTTVSNEEWAANYFLDVSSTDTRGNKVGDTRYISIVPKNEATTENTTLLNIISEKNNLLADTTTELQIISPADMTVLVSFERGRIYDPQWLSLKKGQNTYRFPVKDNYMPSITPTFAIFYQGNYYLEGLSLNVPAMKNLLDVSITPDKTNYVPGETAKIKIKVTNAQDQPVIANLGASVVDKAIFAIKKSATPAMHSSFYYFRERNTDASSSLTGVLTYPWGDGGKGGGGGGEGLGKLVDTLYWNPDLVTDVNGEVIIEIPIINYKTIWRLQVFASTSDTKVGQSFLDFTVN